MKIRTCTSRGIDQYRIMHYKSNLLYMKLMYILCDSMNGAERKILTFCTAHAINQSVKNQTIFSLNKKEIDENYCQT